MKRNDIIKINGNRYNAATGEKLDEPAKTATKTRRAPAKKRLSKTAKQNQLAHEIATEIAEYEGEAPARRSRKPAAKKIAKTTPNWVNDFVDGKEPAKIAVDSGFVARQNRAAYGQNRAAAKAQTAHRHTNTSTTLNRHFVRAPKAQVSAGVARRTSAPIATSPLIHHFAKTAIANAPAAKTPAKIAPQPAKSATKKTFANSSAQSRVREKEKPYVEHPVEIVANHQLSSVVRRPQKPAAASHVLRRPTNNSRTSYGTKFLSDIRREAHETARGGDSKALKEALINEQLNSPITKLSPRERRRAERLQRHLTRKEENSHRHLRVSTFIVIGVTMLLAGGYLAFVNMPKIALGVAAAQAGVDAKTVLTASGYSATGNVAYESGQVTVKYRNNSGGAGYSLTQSKTNLSAAAIRETVIPSNSKSIGGGVYRYGDTTVWVSGDTLFTLNGNDFMTNDQIREIANSTQS